MRLVVVSPHQLVMLSVGPSNPVDRDAMMTRLAAEGYWRHLHPGPPTHQHSRWMTIDQDFMRLLDG